jgi:hypothetical protein
MCDREASGALQSISSTPNVSGAVPGGHSRAHLSPAEFRPPPPHRHCLRLIIQLTLNGARKPDATQRHD